MSVLCSVFSVPMEPAAAPIGFMQNASYFANFALEGMSGIFSLAVGCGDFAKVLQSGFGQLSAAPMSLVTSQESMVLVATNYGDVTAVQFAAVFFIIVLLMSALLLGTNLWEKWTGQKPKSGISPLPLPVELTKQMATKDELRDAEADIEKRFDRLEEAQESQRMAARTAISNVHKRIDKVVENTSEIKGELKQVNENLGRLLDRNLK